MSAYKSYTLRRTAESTETSTMDKLKDKVDRIQELFPNWSAEDLHSVLLETNGDVELAVARISEGHAEQWGSVTRKKDKKTAHHPPTSSQRGVRLRPTGDSRGGRGGRGGRGRGGGGGRGGRGAGPGAANRPPREGSSTTTPAVNGAAAASGVQTEAGKADGASTGVNDVSTSSPQAVDTAPTTTSVSKEVVSTSVAVTTKLSSEPTKVVDVAPTTIQNGAQKASKVPIKMSKVAPGTKLSWAQIARAPEKPKQPPPPSQPSTSAASLEPTLIAQEDIPPPLSQEEEWEEPTTAQGPPWDEEPVATSQPTGELQITNQDGWIMSESIPPRPSQQEAWDASTELAQPPKSPGQKAEEPITATPSPSIATTTVSIATSTSNVTTSTAPTSKPPTPSVSSARPTPGHRASARYPKTDQAVVIPAFAGNIGVSTEKLGMQFGSLSLGAEDGFDNAFKTEPESPAPPPVELQKPQQSAVQSQVQTQTPQLQSQPAVQTQPQDTIQASTTSSISSQPIFQQQAQTGTPSAATAHVQSPAQHTPQIPHHQAQQPSAGPPFSSQVPPVLGHQQQQPLVQPQQATHGYASQQHGIHSQFDGSSLSQNAQHAPVPQSAYFRQTESPYYHNPTPPQSAPPEHQPGYAAFSPLGPAGSAHGHTPSLGGQGASAHLGGFGTGAPGDYGYGDSQRGFYDYQQNTFSARLGHDESTKSGLPLSQPNPPTGSLGTGAGQPQASNPAQPSSGQPPANQQGQQGYPAHMPFYYPPYYPQNSYPTYPNPSYGQYMPKYPPVYHQGPIAPGSAPPPAGKGPGSNAPYNASTSQSHLYHNQGAFDENAGYQHHQGSTNLGAADYPKQGPHQQQPLYGGQTAQGLQSFLGMQQSGGPGQGVGGPGGPPRSNTNPESAYKQYGGAGAGNDKSGVGIGSQPNQQGRAGGIQQTQQQQGGSSFYPGGRFGSSTGPQQQGQQQQGQGYPQTTDQGQFYPYQPRHQGGGYWQ